MDLEMVEYICIGCVAGMFVAFIACYAFAHKITLNALKKVDEEISEFYKNSLSEESDEFEAFVKEKEKIYHDRIEQLQKDKEQLQNLIKQKNKIHEQRGSRSMQLLAESHHRTNELQSLIDEQTEIAVKTIRQLLIIEQKIKKASYNLPDLERRLMSITSTQFSLEEVNGNQNFMDMEKIVQWQEAIAEEIINSLLKNYYTSLPMEEALNENEGGKV